MNKEDIKNAVLLNGAKCETKQQLLEYFSEKLDFPDYFHPNWDSFEEILNDIEINSLVIIYNFDKCLINETENLETFKDIINQYNTKKTIFYFLKSNF